ncbi:DoxX family protein [Isoptericola jiangsuensis]|uniref:DoxX family protein n=1 Tax=Isoptericola jiangsuensis TaxID=548579 RepID=UPI003AAE8AC6
MDIALWIAQVLLALVFLAAGTKKAASSKEKLEESLPWTANVPREGVRLLGIAEILGALGLILPAATGILPVLTPIAAVALAVVMVLAAVFHARRQESKSVVVNVVLMLMAVFVAWGWFGPYAF